MRGEEGHEQAGQKTYRHFSTKQVMPDETLEAQLDGWLDKPTGQGGVIKHNGQFVLYQQASLLLFQGSVRGDIRDDPTLENNVGRDVVADGLPCAPSSHGA
jgi:hypothetical protein